MSELAIDGSRPRKPRPPVGAGAWTAVVLEALMVAAMIGYRAWLCLAFAAVYFHFSATRAVAFDLFGDD